MTINNDSFENTHCDVCGGLNYNERSYTCEDCIEEQKKKEDRMEMLEELEE